ncbi:MAG: cadherin repeat domain-containing protein, partial [candidate division Zixibacteria bacterium]|nr:cadherin repeat domain-containing protein [candidate division Zixibacteria bacterium]
MITNEDPADTLYSVWCITLCDSVEAYDPDGGCNSLLYTILSFDGPVWFDCGMTIDAATGKWCWCIAEDNEYLGNFTLCVVVSDGANTCDPCSPSNADTACYNINITGFSITIEKVHGQLQGHFTDVSIYLDSAYMPDVFCCDLLGGFDFLIAYDPSALTAMSVAPGALIDNDKFEYFTYRFGPFGNCGDGCPSGLLRIVSLREENDGVVNPYHLTGPGELAVMKFFVSGDYNLQGQYVPIQFYWIDCGDNTLSDESGNWLYLALKVYSHEGLDHTDPAEFFGYSGPEAYCYDTVYHSDSTFKNAPIAAIIFRNGGVDIIPIPLIDDRGDVNLNGIPNEIADAVVFTNYFIYGPSAFSINFEGQKAATEVNGDGIALTVADLVYLVRIIVGDALPLPAVKVNPDALAEFASQGSTISVETNANIGAVLLVFNGMVTPTLATDASYMDMIYHYEGNSTRVLVYSFEKGDAITSGELLYTDGEASLVSVDAAEYRGVSLKTVYEILPTDFALGQNYPNPFNP